MGTTITRQNYYSATYSSPSTSYYYEPQADYSAAPSSATNNSATVRVLLPDANARVWFDGAPTQQTGADRVFNTPALAPGATNNYRIRASWMQNGQEVTQERIVAVTPGASAVVDFR